MPIINSQSSYWHIHIVAVCLCLYEQQPKTQRYYISSETSPREATSPHIWEAGTEQNISAWKSNYTKSSDYLNGDQSVYFEGAVTTNGRHNSSFENNKDGTQELLWALLWLDECDDYKLSLTGFSEVPIDRVAPHSSPVDHWRWYTDCRVTNPLVLIKSSAHDLQVKNAKLVTLRLKNVVAPSVVLRLMQRRRVLSRTNGGLQKQLNEPAVFTHSPSSQAFPRPHSS